MIAHQILMQNITHALQPNSSPIAHRVAHKNPPCLQDGPKRRARDSNHQPTSMDLASSGALPTERVSVRCPLADSER